MKAPITRQHTKRRELTRKVGLIAKSHARAAFLAAAGFVASAAAHAQQAHPRPTGGVAAMHHAWAPQARTVESVPQDAPSWPSGATTLDWHAYVEANRRVLAGQADLAAAMGLDGAAGQAASAAGALGADDGEARRVTGAALSRIGGAQQSIAQALSQAFASMSPPARFDRDAFSSGLASLGEGLQRFEMLPRPGDDTPADTDAARFAAHAPDQIDAAAATLNDAARYAAVHGIEVPPVATLALRAVSR